MIRPYFGDREILGLFRIGGAGLGNLLFVYARAYILSLQKGFKLIPPIWPTFKIGPLIRFEKEQRFYLDLFQPHLLERWQFLIKGLKYSEIQETELANQQNKVDKTIINVSGLKNYFKDLEGYHQELSSFFYLQSNTKVKSKIDAFNGANTIGIHIRLGDYDEAGKTSIIWYQEKIKQIRSLKKYENYKLVVFSDGKNVELKEILSLPNCMRVDKPDALSGILRLAKCEIIIGSNSTFSAWSAFLGRKPFIRHEKFYMNKLYHVKELIYEGCLPDTDLPNL